MVRQGWVAGAFALLIYAAIAAVCFCHGANFNTKYIGLGSDPFLMMWYLNWWPFAITHLINPFYSHYVWAPHGLNVAAATSLPLVAILMAPVTLLMGVAFSYNLLDIAGPVFAAWASFLLADALTDDLAASLVGGYLFGFSAYESGQVLGHLNLDMICFIPLAILLCVRRRQDRLSKARFICTLAICLIFEMNISIEGFATFAASAALSWAIFLLCAPRADRLAWRRLAGEIIAAAALGILISSVYLIYLVIGLEGLQPVMDARFVAEPLSYLVPTQETWLLHDRFAAISNSFNGNLAEQDAYLGLPLLAILLLYLVSQGGKPYGRALLLSISAIAVLSFGPVLHIGGKTVPMPWAAILHLPLISMALPVRFTMYVALGTSMAAALWLSSGRGRKPLKYLLAAAACIALVPNRDAHSWASLPEDPYFTPRHIETTLGDGKNVLSLPFAYSGPGMYWQITGGMHYVQTAGYTGFPPKPEVGWSIQDSLGMGVPGPDFSDRIQAYCDAHHTDFVLLGPGTAAPIVQAFAVLGWPVARKFDVAIYKVPPAGLMRYRNIAGDYYPSDSWIGRKVTITTKNEPATLILTEGAGPSRLVRLTMTGAGKRLSILFKDRRPQTLLVPANQTVMLTTNDFFIADPLYHNGDMRPITLQISLSP